MSYGCANSYVVRKCELKRCNAGLGAGGERFPRFGAGKNGNLKENNCKCIAIVLFGSLL